MKKQIVTIVLGAAVMLGTATSLFAQTSGVAVGGGAAGGPNGIYKDPYISPAHEIPDIVVSTTEALVKCGIFMVSIALSYGDTLRCGSSLSASLRNGAYRTQGLSVYHPAQRSG